jgi:bifunctional DNA-binding transcriptional regulator/antitoxin component of YhaV-PrlF toxin-antitoxin module
MEFSFSSKLIRLDSQVWYVAIKVPNKIGDAFKKAEHKRMIATYNKTHDAPCAFMPATEKGYWLMINKEIRKKFKIEAGDKIDVVLRPDTSKYGIPLPPEMEELLLQDEIGNHYFHTLTPGKQRSLLYTIGKPKGSETRLKKAVAIMEYLKLVKGKLDFREMNEFIKNFEF